MRYSIYRLLNFYFPVKLFKLYGLRSLFFIISTLPLYPIYDILGKVLGDPARVFHLKPRISFMLFTPSANILIGFLDFSILNIIHEIYVEEVYNKLLDYEVKPGWVLVDAGANIGGYTLFAVDRKSRLVIALEPDPRSYRRLINTLKVNRIKNVVALPYALTDKNDLFNFIQSSDVGTSHIRRFSEGGKSINIRGVKLIKLIELYKLNYIDLLKLDIEGAEYGVISSSNEGLKEGRVKRIVGELHGEEKDIDKLINSIQNLGFKIEYQQRSKNLALIHAKFDE